MWCKVWWVRGRRKKHEVMSDWEKKWKDRTGMTVSDMRGKGEKKRSERGRETQWGGVTEKDNRAGEEIVDIQQGQQRYAGHLLL